MRKKSYFLLWKFCFKLFFNFVEILDIYGKGMVGGSGDDFYGSGSGFYVIEGFGMEGSGFMEKSGDGSDGDDEDFNKFYRLIYE